MLVTPFGIEILVKLTQSSNALCPMLVTPFCIFTDNILERLL